MVAYTLLKLQFDLDLEPELENKEELTFAVGTDNFLHVKITKTSF